MNKPTHAIVTAAVHDMNGFVELGRISVDDYVAAQEVPQSETAYQEYILDLWDKKGHYDDKIVTRATAAQLLGVDVLGLDQFARQKLAQINDEDAEHVRKMLARGVFAQ